MKHLALLFSILVVFLISVPFGMAGETEEWKSCCASTCDYSWGGTAVVNGVPYYCCQATGGWTTYCPPPSVTGPCTDDYGNYLSSSEPCSLSETQISCYAGNDCGDDVWFRVGIQYCSGSSSYCNGAVVWTDWEVLDSCGMTETCTNGDSTCNYNANCDPTTWPCYSLGESACTGRSDCCWSYVWGECFGEGEYCCHDEAVGTDAYYQCPNDAVDDYVCYPNSPQADAGGWVSGVSSCDLECVGKYINSDYGDNTCDIGICDLTCQCIDTTTPITYRTLELTVAENDGEMCLSYNGNEYCTYSSRSVTIPEYTVVTVNATADEGYEFDRFGGLPGDTSENPVTFSVVSDGDIYVYFEESTTNTTTTTQPGNTTNTTTTTLPDDTTTTTLPAGSDLFTFNIYAGWNLISSPFADITDVSSDTCDAASANYYYYDRNSMSWVVDTVGIENLEPGIGYWFYSTSSCTVSIVGSTDVITSDISIHSGWNHVGSPADGLSNTNSIMSGCSEPRVLLYNPLSQQFEEVSSLQAGRGYNVYCGS